jgi:hypothetical protein
MDAPQRPLIAVAEGIEAERQATRRLRDAKTEQLLVLLENLVRSARANTYAACVLRWLVEHGALEDEGAELDAKIIAGDAWVMASEPTVRRAIRFWESVFGAAGPVLVAKDQIDKAGRLTARRGRVNIDAVKRFLNPDETKQEPDPRSNRSTLDLIDRPSIPQIDPRSNRPDIQAPNSEAQFEARKRLMLENLARADAVESPPRPMDSNEELSINSSKLQRLNQGEPSLDALGALEAGDPDDAMRVGSHIAARLEKAVADFCDTGDPKAIREHWKRRINLAVGNPAERDWWVAGKTSTLIANGDVEEGDVKKIIDSVIRRRNLPPDDENFIAAPQGWFQSVVARICNTRGIAFSKRSSQNTEAVDVVGAAGEFP